jgi:hypothetical protein
MSVQKPYVLQERLHLTSPHDKQIELFDHARTLATHASMTKNAHAVRELTSRYVEQLHS